MIRALLPVLAALAPCAARAAAGIAERFPPAVEKLLYEERLWPALDLSEKLAADPALSPTQRALAWRQSGELRARVGDVQGAEADFERSLAAGPRDPRTLLALAAALRERPRVALGYAQDAGASPEAGLLRGEILLDLGEDAGARKALGPVLETRPADLAALRALTRASRREEAEAYARRAESAAAAAPDWLREAALRLAAATRLDAGEPTEAVRCFRRALSVDPEDLDALTALKELKEKGAVWPPDGAKGPSPGPAKAWAAEPLVALREEISVAAKKGAADDAAALAESFVDAVPRAPAWQRVSAYREIGRVWAELGDALKAKLCLVMAERLDPASPATVRLRYDLGDHGPDVVGAISFANLAVENARFDAGEPELRAKPAPR